MTSFVPPFKVHLCWFEGSTSNARCAEVACELYELLHRPIHDDVVLRPGLEIPIEYGRDLSELLDALDGEHEPKAGVRMVIAILDSVAYAQPRARKIISDRALVRWSDARTDEVFLAVVLDARWERVLAARRFVSLTNVEAHDDASDHAACRWKFSSEVMVLAGRALLRRLHSVESPKPRIFISHARADAAKLVKPLVARIQAEMEDNPWFDVTGTHHGEEFGRRLVDTSGDGVVLVIRTDRYFETPSCRTELRAAKRAGVPIVTLLATRDGELWTSEHSGNHRTLQWTLGREWEVVTRCLQAWLHHHHFRAYAAAALERSGLPADSGIVLRRPELLDVVGAAGRAGRHLLIHPDPPMTEGEANELRLAVPSVRLATPTTLFGRVLLARDPAPPLAGTTVAFSLSVTEDLPFVEDGRLGSGLTQQHLDDVVYSIVLATLSSGARIAYGGDFRRSSGYAKKLSDLHRSWGKLGASSQLVCFLDSAEGPAGRGGDAGNDIDFEPVDVPAPAGAEEFPAQRSLFWHMAMREKMARDCNARILLGGKARARVDHDGGYIGPWPGLLEEAWRTLQFGRALYVIGGFGGTAELIARMLESEVVPDELTAAHQAGKPVEQIILDFDAARNALVSRGVSASLLGAEGKLHGIEDLARSILERWVSFASASANQDAWNNGLSITENRQLFRSTDRTEITHLVFEGLRRLPRATKDHKASWALYQGDIASLVDVDGYAVTSTPGVPAVGAMAALDARMDGRLASVTWPDGTDVALVQVAAGGLAGRQVLLARLALPPAGERVSAASIQRLAEKVAQRADEVGFTSIACAPFGTTMGISVEEAARAMIAGFTAASSVQKTVVLCEIDRGRYEQLRRILGSDAIELRPGATAVATARSVVLHLQATAPTSAEPYGRINATLFAPHDTEPVVPYANASLTWPFWFEIRDRYVDFDKTTRMGRLLWQTFLSEKMRARIVGETDGRLVILTDKNSSGLPWEIMIGDDGVPIALSSDVVRRVALAGASTRPDPRTSRGSRLRVLIVVHPAGLRNAVIEADAVEAVLRGRADVEVKRLEGPDANVKSVRDALADGFYDVLHYAGHAAFDETTPERSGLRLVDGVFTGELLPSVAPPGLVFLSACESGRLRREVGEPAAPTSNGLSLAETFLRNGVAALIGTFMAVDDRAACIFATTVYTQLAAGRVLGLAVRVARKALYDTKSPDSGNFMLFGDDHLNL